MVSDKEIEDAEEKDKLVIEEIKSEQSVRNVDKDPAADSHWDKDF